MSIHLALDRLTNDLIIGDRGMVRVSEGRFVVQQVRSKLRTVLGEWVLDRSVGLIEREDLEKNYDAFDLETRITEIILGTAGVLVVDEVTQTYNKRKLTISFKARTIYGEISSEVAW